MDEERDEVLKKFIEEGLEANKELLRSQHSPCERCGDREMDATLFRLSCDYHARLCVGCFNEAHRESCPVAKSQYDAELAEAKLKWAISGAKSESELERFFGLAKGERRLANRVASEWVQRGRGDGLSGATEED